MLPSTSTSSVKNLKQHFEKKPEAKQEGTDQQKYLNTPVKRKSQPLVQPPVISSTSSSPISKEREELNELARRRGSIKDLQNKFSTGEASNSSKVTTEVDISLFKVDVKDKRGEIDTKHTEAIKQQERNIIKRTKQQVSKQETVYINPFSESIKLEVFKNPGTHVGTFNAFIETNTLKPGDYTCKPYVEMGETKKEAIRLTEFNFKVLDNRKVSPDFHDLRIADVNFEFKNKDLPVTCAEANCTLKTQHKVTEFKCKTDVKGRFNQVIPPGTLDIHIPSCDIQLKSTIIEPLPVTSREDALKMKTPVKTTSKNSTLAGSSIPEEGDFVVLGDASRSMHGAPYITLIKSLNRFATDACIKSQKIAVGLWGNRTIWFKNGDFLDITDIAALDEFLNYQANNLLPGTLLKQALDSTFNKYPDIANILIMCDGQIGDINSAEAFQEIRKAHPNTTLHFTAIGTTTARDHLDKFSQWTNGNYEFSDINKL